MILEEQFPVPRNTAVSKIGNGVISLLCQLRCHCNPDHNKVSSLSKTTVLLISPNLCKWRRSSGSHLGGIDPEKLYRATLRCCQPLADLNHTYLFEDPPLFAALEMELFTDLSLNEQVWLMQ